MVFVSKKGIKGKMRYYLEKSVRLPGGAVKKFSVYLKDYEPKSGLRGLDSYVALLNAKARATVINHVAEFYTKSSIFSNGVIKGLEEVKLAYNGLRKKISKKQLQDVIDRFTVNFTYESNAIEGNSLTLKDVAIVLHEKKAIEGKDLREIYEALNTREAMKLIFNNKLKISEHDIIKLHKILVRNTDVAFGYKKLPNFLLGRDTQTTPPEKVEEEMRELITWYHENERMHPLERASIFHGRFETIHPFEDGNGRVGRLLINIMLMDNGYPPLIIRKTHRIAYLAGLEAFDHGYSDKLKRLLIDKYKTTYKKFFEVYVQYLNFEKKQGW
ncbi:Fic family protein [Candidatus Woesearchaeota archaeon]|nr:Fic family protein [Candidatus Woesearchaeota archaeon]